MARVAVATVLILTAARPYTLANEHGDTHPPIDCVYPPRVFLHEGRGGHFLDVTKPPFNARGDGRTDDTAAFVRAYDYVLAEMDKAPWGGGGPTRNDDFAIYIPNGTYLLSDTVIYSGPPRVGRKPGKPNKWEQLARIRFIGQSRQKTVLRLRDRCPGFGKGKRRPVVSFAKNDFNNHKAFHVVRNLTIDTGRGNPGAVGLDFQGANLAEIHNVTIRSGDGLGAAGLRMHVAPTVGNHRDITVEGFDVGVHLDLWARATHVCFEHVTLRGQREAGIRLDRGASTSIRRLLTEGKTPALNVASPSAHAVILDSRMTSEGTESPAIDLAAGQLLARGVRTRGFARAVGGKAAGGGIAGPLVEHYVSGGTFALSGKVPEATLSLSVRGVPRVPWDRDLSRWACPEDHGAKADGRTDDTAAVQAAMDSAKSTVYFPSRRYRTTGEIRVPASVRRVTGLFHSLRMRFAVAGDAKDAVAFEDFSHATILLDGRRPALVSLADWASYRNRLKADGATLFLNGAHGPDARTNPPGAGRLRIWARSINSEGRSLPFVTDRADLWIMGFKTERGAVQFDVRNGSRVEILGGTFGVQCTGPFVRNAGGTVGLTVNTSGFGLRGREQVVAEMRSAGTTALRVSRFPDRPDKGNNVFIPLVVSTVEADR